MPEPRPFRHCRSASSKTRTLCRLSLPASAAPPLIAAPVQVVRQPPRRSIRKAPPSSEAAGTRQGKTPVVCGGLRRQKAATDAKPANGPPAETKPPAAEGTCRLRADGFPAINLAYDADQALDATPWLPSVTRARVRPPTASRPTTRAKAPSASVRGAVFADPRCRGIGALEVKQAEPTGTSSSA
jgi:hypothetical protein